MDAYRIVCILLSYFGKKGGMPLLSRLPITKMPLIRNSRDIKKISLKSSKISNPFHRMGSTTG
jgi:hypothetical protein